MKNPSSVIWIIWLSGLLLITVSFYTTTQLLQIKNPNSVVKIEYPRITIFTSPEIFSGSIGEKQSLVIRSWLALSEDISVVLFSRHHSVFAFAADSGHRVSVEPDVDFTFLGTPFFHSMVARAQAFKSDISVIVDADVLLLPDLISTLNHAIKLDRDFLLYSSSKSLSSFPFHFDSKQRNWVTKDRKWVRPKKVRAFVLGNSQREKCEHNKTLLAWNNGALPLHNGVIPPFIYGKGIHNRWIISEAMSSDFRLVFDASSLITNFYINKPNRQINYWESKGNSYLGATYGSLYFHEANYSNIAKLERHFTLMSVKRNRECSVKDILTPSVSLELPFGLENLLEKQADENRTIVLATAGYSYKDMLMSWVCRLNQLRVSNFIVCALDDETYQFSILQGLPVFKDSFAPNNISFDDCHFGTECFQKVTKAKSRIVLHILKLDYNVLLSDVDVYWFKNPIPLLKSFGPAVLVAQSDEFNLTGPINLPRKLNSGFYYAHSDFTTIAALEKVVNHAAKSNLSEQPSFYDTLCGPNGSLRISYNRCLEPETNLTVHFLDRDLFPNGAYKEMWNKKDVKKMCNDCFVLHNNWVSGRRKKLERQVSSGLWEYDSSTRMCVYNWQKNRPFDYF